MNQALAPASAGQQQRALWLTTFAFTVCFAVWTIFSIIGVAIKAELGLNDTQFGLLVGITRRGQAAGTVRRARRDGVTFSNVQLIINKKVDTVHISSTNPGSS